MVKSFRKPITSFRDLEIYQNTYEAMLIVAKGLLNQLPVSEKYDLRNQLSRSTKAIPRLIAEGYAKKHQRAGFQKYLDDAMAECNETIVSIEQARDLYNLDLYLCDSLIEIYDKSVRQIYRLAEAWTKFKNFRKTTPSNYTSSDTAIR